MNVLLKKYKWYGCILLLSVVMTVAYPVHLIIDHAGIYHHHEEHDDLTEDDFCLFCINMHQVENSRPMSILLTGEQVRSGSDQNEVTGIGDFQLFPARGPPFSLSITETFYKKQNV